MSQAIKPIYAWALASRGRLNICDIVDSRDDAIAYQNKPAGQRVVQVKISAVPPKRRRKTK